MDRDRPRIVKKLYQLIIRHRHSILLCLAIFFVLGFKVIAFTKAVPYVPSGDDAQVHFAYTNHIKEFGWPQNIYFSYPPGFHTFTAWASKLSGINTLDFLHIWAIILIPLGMAAIYFLVNQLTKSNLTAVFAAILFGTFSPQPQQTIGDGGLPNVLAASVFLPIGIGLLYSGLSNKKWSQISYSGIFLFLAVVTHQISTLYFLILGTIIFFLFILTHLANWRFILGSLALWLTMGGLGMLLVWGAYREFLLPLGQTVWNNIWAFFSPPVADSGTQTTAGSAGSVASSIGSQPPVPIQDYPQYLGGGLVWLAAAGFVAALVRRFEKNGGVLFVAIWLIIFLIISQTDLVFYPARFARELVIPMTLIAGWFIALAWVKIPRHLGKIAVLAVLYFGITVFISAHRQGGIYPVPVVKANEGLAIDWLANHTQSGDTIVLGSTVSYLQYLEHFLPGRKFYLINSYYTLLIDQKNFGWQGNCRPATRSVYYYERNKDSEHMLTTADQIRAVFGDPEMEENFGSAPAVRIFQRLSDEESRRSANSCVRDNR